MPNRLARASSPYLQQHAGNPVDWYEWGGEALDRAAREDKPIHLSIGYAACHWCHVMAHESFEDPETAALLNQLFVNVKVDREERPDLDGIYMQAVQAMTGHGGWPMTVFLFPDGAPFYGGTYFPPEDRHGLPGFRRVARAVADAYRERRADVRRSADRLREIYVRQGPTHAEPITGAGLEEAALGLARSYDPVHGGFGGAPKFPPSMALSFLVAQWSRTGDARALTMARDTFLAMARGGIFDQLGGGLHRYSVDDRWLVPHFEKMLYDNALFVRAGIDLWQATRDREIRAAVLATLGWLEREMRAPEGGFYSSIDADSEGEEGRFYVWSAAAIRSAAGADAGAAAARWGVSEAGNFEGTNVLHVAADWETTAREARLGVAEAREGVERARAALLDARNLRVRPTRDDKIVAAWNGLTLRSLALAARVLGDARCARLASSAAEFLMAELVRDGRVRRAWRDGATRAEGFLEDQGAVGLGFLELFGLTGKRRWLDAAVELADATIAHFRDPASGTLYDTPDDHEPLISRPSDPTDNATPSGASLAAELLLRVAILTGRDDLDRAGRSALDRLANGAVRFPTAFGNALLAMDFVAYGSIEVVVAAGEDPSDSGQALLDAVATEYVPSLTLVHGTAAAIGGLPISAGKTPLDRAAAAYVCRRFVCGAPVTDAGELEAALRSVRRRPSEGPLGTT